jgi:hypothetical protein
MDNRSLLRALAVAAVTVAAAAVIAVSAYNAGVAHGIAESARVATTAPPAGAAPYPYPYFWARPWGFGFFPIFPFFLLLFFFFVVRGLLWRGPWRGGWRRYRYDGVPPAFEEWHRRAHAAEPTAKPGSTT